MTAVNSQNTALPRCAYKSCDRPAKLGGLYCSNSHRVCAARYRRRRAGLTLERWGLSANDAKDIIDIYGMTRITEMLNLMGWYWVVSAQDWVKNYGSRGPGV